MESVRSGWSSKVNERTVGRGGKQNAREKSMSKEAQNAREETFLPMVLTVLKRRSSSFLQSGV
jgi:hypothetical protein